MTPKSLESFIGKVCSVFTVPGGRSLDGEEWVTYHVGTVESIDQYGVLVRSIRTGRANFYFRDKIIGLCEEHVEVLDLDNPEHAKAIQNMQRPPKQRQQSPIKEEMHQQEANNSPFVDIGAISELAKRAKTQFKKGS